MSASKKGLRDEWHDAKMNWFRPDLQVFFLISPSAHGAHQYRVPCKYSQHCESPTFIAQANKSTIGIVKY